MLRRARRLAYGTDQGRWLMEQVQATPDGAAKRRATRPQHAFHNDDTICGPPQTGAPAPASDALSVRQGMPSEGGKQLWQQPRVMLAVGAALSMLFVIFLVSR